MASQYGLVRAAETLVTDFMCVKKGEEVLITADTDTDTAVVWAVAAVAEGLGAKPTISTAPRLPFQGKLADPYISRVQAEATRACDVWIDLAFPYYAGSHVQDEAMKTDRVRYLLGGDMRSDSFERLFGGVDFDQYFDAQYAFDELFSASIGKRCRITTKLGTDVSFLLDKTGLNKPRGALKPGMYLVPGTCSIAPKIETVRGSVVVTRSFHEFYESLDSPATLEVNGRISKVTGGGASRPPLERAMLRAGGGEFGSIIHFAHGLHPAARLTGTSFIEDIRAVGSNAVGLGIPWWEPGGGENHPDAVLTEHSLWVDDEQIIRDGMIVAPRKLADKAARLAPR